MASPPRVNAAGWLHQSQDATFGSASAARSATTTRQAIGQFLNRTAPLFHNRCNVFDNTIDLLLRCVKYRHSRMTRINGSNERLFKRVDRKSLRKIPERRRLGIRALTGETDRVATRTVLCHERPSARDTIVRTSPYHQCRRRTLLPDRIESAAFCNRFSISASWTRPVNSLAERQRPQATRRLNRIGTQVINR